jgi:hypothetical protein
MAISLHLGNDLALAGYVALTIEDMPLRHVQVNFEHRPIHRGRLT